MSQMMNVQDVPPVSDFPRNPPPDYGEGHASRLGTPPVVKDREMGWQGSPMKGGIVACRIGDYDSSNDPNCPYTKTKKFKHLQDKIRG
jgi:hypothetical protein